MRAPAAGLPSPAALGPRARFLAGRTLASLASCALLVTLTFFLARLAPGGPAYAILGSKVTLSRKGAIDLELGLNVAVWKQYAIWWWHVLHGDFGVSYKLDRPVAALLAEYEANTWRLYALGLAGALVLAAITGLVHGLAAPRLSARIAAGVELLFYALPGFVIGTVLIALFADRLHWLPPAGDADLRLAAPSAFDRLRHLVLPAATVALFGFAPLSRYLALGIIETRAAPHILAARAAGVPPLRLFWHHILPNALRPMVTIAGLTFPLLVSGSVLIESVFNYPGLGWLLWYAALDRDYPVLVAIVLLGGVATIAANFAADLVASWLDPRVRFD